LSDFGGPQPAVAKVKQIRYINDYVKKWLLALTLNWDRKIHSSENSSGISEGEKCCVCKLMQPKELKNFVFLVFT
jgi:hypothetical protein